MSILSVENVTMRFGGLTAVKEVSLTVEEGQIYSVIGPNGAGKTTLFNAITGIYNPTSGNVLFEGKPQLRPYSARLFVMCVLIGLLMSCTAFLISLNVDSLWLATIKRLAADPSEPFSYRRAIDAAFDYYRGDLAVEKARASRLPRWVVVTLDGKTELARMKSLEEAQQARKDLIAGELRIVFVRETGDWAVRDASGERNIKLFFEKSECETYISELTQVQAKAAGRRLIAQIAAGIGFVLGMVGTFVLWRRSRRTAEWIALNGIARTFQNIRLFHNMTVLENVLIGLDRTFRGNVIKQALRTPGLRREEADRENAARELLAFMGLNKLAGNLAKNLPYGDQRRLEIARALACNPKLLLLDEPAAGMNPTETRDLMHLIRRIRDERKITILLIEHHMELVMGISDRISVLNFGAKIAEGTPSEIKANPEVIKAYLGEEEVG